MAKRRAVIVGFVAMLAACADGQKPTDEPISQISQAREAIVAGTGSGPDQDATVLLLQAGAPSCSGTLIAPNLILTARHCVTDFNDRDPCGLPLGGDVPSNVLTVAVGANATRKDVRARGARTFVPAAAPNGLCGADVALLLLDREIGEVKPVVVGFDAPAVGEAGTAIGYGEDGLGRVDILRRQRPGVKVLALGPSKQPYATANGAPLTMSLVANDFATGESTCFGDSGGPFIDGSGRVVAVASRGASADPEVCVDRPTYWTSLAPFEPLVRQAATEAGHPLPAPTPTAALSPGAGPGVPQSAFSPAGSGAPTAGSGSAPPAAGGCAFAPSFARPVAPPLGRGSAGAWALLALAALVRRRKAAWRSGRVVTTYDVACPRARALSSSPPSSLRLPSWPRRARARRTRARR